MAARTFLGSSAATPSASRIGWQDRPFALGKRQILAEGPGQHQDVAEQDRRIHAEAPYRLERDFGGLFRRGAEIHEPGGGGADGAVLGRKRPAWRISHTGGVPHRSPPSTCNSFFVIAYPVVPLAPPLSRIKR